MKVHKAWSMKDEQLKGWGSFPAASHLQSSGPGRSTQDKVRWERGNYANSNWKRHLLMKVDFKRVVLIMGSWKGCTRIRNEYWFGISGGGGIICIISPLESTSRFISSAYSQSCLDSSLSLLNPSLSLSPLSSSITPSIFYFFNKSFPP